MSIEDLLVQVQNLDDLELAVLLSLVTQQHCLITTDDESQDDLASTLASIVSRVFGLSYAVVAPEDQQSVDTFGAAILNSDLEDTGGFSNKDTIRGLSGSRLGSTIRGLSGSRLGSTSSLRASSHIEGATLDRRAVANVVIAKSFNHAHRDVQIAVLELIRRRRIFSRTTVHPVPKVFLFIPLVGESTKHIRLNHHLNDRISISHHHDFPEGPIRDSFDHVDKNTVSDIDGNSSPNRSTTDSATDDSKVSHRRIDPAMIELLQRLSKNVNMTSEIRRYIQDIVVFLRMERGVDGGVSPFATSMLVDLAKSLAALHGIDYVTPSLVGLAARKIYAHRLTICVPERERSIQWRSDVDAVRRALKGLTPEIIIENCLSTVPCPK